MNSKYTKMSLLGLGLLALSNVQAEVVPLLKAVYAEDIDQVKTLIQVNPDINQLGPSWYGNGSALHVAVRTGQQDMAKLLIDRGAIVDVRDHNDYTPLHNAAWNGNLEMVKLLLGAGADINARTYTGRTVLGCARRKNQLEVIQFLEDKLQLGSN
jgi:ankyrin repeat protein